MTTYYAAQFGITLSIVNLKTDETTSSSSSATACKRQSTVTELAKENTKNISPIGGVEFPTDLRQRRIDV